MEPFLLEAWAKLNSIAGLKNIQVDWLPEAGSLVDWLAEAGSLINEPC